MSICNASIYLIFFLVFNLSLAYDNLKRFNANLSEQSFDLSLGAYYENSYIFFSMRVIKDKGTNDRDRRYSITSTTLSLVVTSSTNVLI